ncbi:hypothetical protein RND81_02G093100 [Saponaria officinalis]|uniref:PPM-type phosphatase domain-containing protein n=1 Tax=Saponaria officinalis TaxID=3572 RepID=A0AAW1MS08_SAPOF
MLVEEIFWSFSIISILFYVFRGIMAVQIPSYPWITKLMVHHSSHEHFRTCSVSSEENVSLDRKIVQVEPSKLRKRPSKLLVPEFSPNHMEFSAEKRRVENVEIEVQGRGHCLVSKKGRREHLEDRFNVISDVFGDPNQAFFAVIDGHGGQEAANYVANNLGSKILNELQILKDADHHQIEEAISRGYSLTDHEFLSQGVGSGACTASVLLWNGQLYAANVGDCRVVLSRAGLASRLTNDHRLSREDERHRIESSGGFVQNYNNGNWRVQGTLAVSRAFGDQHLKEWIICDPEIQHLPLSSDSQFLILASDGLWDKVNDQEAVDIVLKEENAMESCKKLVDLSFKRGNRDDITVIVINLQKFVTVSA